MSDEILLVCSTFPQVETAREIARQLVTENLAACANIIPAVESIYRWKGSVESAKEFLLVIKSTQVRFAALRREIERLHSYEVPEVIAVPIGKGSPKYLRWLAESVSGKPRS